ncbi:MAG: hypothetical protein JW892_02040 [Anaerolineae bacterium]|nr:hypothetical protein [Anaerolineae bacterium]
MKVESSGTTFQKAIAGLKRMFASLRNRISPPRRQPELWELEARFTKGNETDPERVTDRQFSNSMRSGRG